MGGVDGLGEEGVRVRANWDKLDKEEGPGPDWRNRGGDEKGP